MLTDFSCKAGILIGIPPSKVVLRSTSELLLCVVVVVEGGSIKGCEGIVGNITQVVHMVCIHVQRLEVAVQVLFQVLYLFLISEPI